MTEITTGLAAKKRKKSRSSLQVASNDGNQIV